MFIELTPEQRQLQAELRQYFLSLISPEEAKEMEANRRGKAYRAVIRRMGPDRKLGVGWPTEFGGLGAFDRSGVLLSGLEWIEWIYVDRRVFNSPPRSKAGSIRALRGWPG